MMKILLIWLKILNCVILTSAGNVFDIESDFLTPLDMSEEQNFRWGTLRECPPGGFVTGYKFNLKSMQLDSQNPISIELIQGIALQCSKFGLWNNIVDDKVIFDGRVSVKESWKSYTNNQHRQVIGFSIIKSTSQNELDQMESGYFGKLKLLFDSDHDSFSFPLNYNQDEGGLQREEEIFCPPEFVVCGFSVIRDPLLHHTIKKLRFRCCYYCIPQEINVVIYDFSNNGITDVYHTVVKKIGLKTSKNYVVGEKEEKSKRVDPGILGEIGTGNYYSQGGGSESRSSKKISSRQGDSGGGGGSMGGGPGQGGSSPGGSPMPNPNPSSGGSGSVPGGGGGSPSGGAGGISPSSGSSGQQGLNLRARFEAKFGKSKNSQFNWEDTSYALWDNEAEETDTLTCKALHRCVLSQLTGVCGKHQFNTPSFDFTSIPFRFDSLSNLQDNSLIQRNLTIERQGEIWIVIENLLFTKPNLMWDEIKLCPPSAVVTAQQLRYKKGVPFSGLNLRCSRLNATDEFEHVATLTTGSGRVKRWYNASSQAIGCTFVEYRMKGLRWKTNFELRFHGDESFLVVPKGAENFKRTLVQCPNSYAICGVQTMYDKERRGQLTNLGFKCCYHCIAQEKTVVLESFTNLGYTDTVQTIRRVVGKNVNNIHASTSSNSTGQLDNTDAINPSGLQAGFAAKFDKSNHGGFSWSQTSNSFWTSQEEKTLTILCKARHLCVYRQLVGTCNEIEIATPYTIKESFPLDGNTKVALKINSLTPEGRIAPQDHTSTSTSLVAAITNKGNGNDEKIKDPEGTWITIRNLTSSSTNGQWDPIQSCPPGSFVTAIKVKFKFKFKSTFKFKMNGFHLKCSSLHKSGNFYHVADIWTGYGLNETIWLESIPQSPINGFNLIQYTIMGSTFKTLFQFIFLNHKKADVYKKLSMGFGAIQSRKSHFCEKNFVFCGIQTMYDGPGILTAVRFRCCYYCQPKEKIVTLSSLINFDSADSIEKVKWVVGSQKIQDKVKPSHDFNSSNNTNLAVEKLVDEISPMDIQAIFSAYFKNSSSSLSTSQFNVSFNFADTAHSLWTNFEVKSTKFNCKAHHICNFKQLIGICGKFQVSTPLIAKQSFLPNAT